MNTAHATLSKDGLLHIHNNTWIGAGIGHTDRKLSELCQLCAARKITHLWVMPDTEIIPNRFFFNEATTEWDLFAAWDIDEQLARDLGQEPRLISVTGCRKPKGGQHWFTIGFPEQCEWSWYDSTMAPKQLLQIVRYLEKALDVPVGPGPSTVGIKLLEQLNAAHKEWIEAPGINLSELHWQDASRDLVWPQELMSIPRHGYLHKFDKRSAYLRACVAEKMGVGTPTHVFHGQGILEKKVGLWKCRLQGNFSQAKNLPPLWPYEGDTAWLTRPIITLLRQQGCNVKADEGWVFPQEHFVLAEWAKDLYAARQSFRDEPDKWKHRPSAEAARDGTKDVATKTVGLFASDVLRQENDLAFRNKGKGVWKYRPDWNAQVVSQHRAVMLHNILKGLGEADLSPFMVYMDALYYITDGPTPEIPGLNIGPALGAYKYEWTLHIDAQVQRALMAGVGVGGKLSQLNRIAAEREVR